MMTNEQMRQAAVNFCKLVGMNPDAPFEGQGKNMPRITNWQAALIPIRDHLALHHAIGSALSGKPLPDFDFKPGKKPKPPRPVKAIIPFRNGAS